MRSNLKNKYSLILISRFINWIDSNLVIFHRIAQRRMILRSSKAFIICLNPTIWWAAISIYQVSIITLQNKKNSVTTNLNAFICSVLQLKSMSTDTYMITINKMLLAGGALCHIIYSGSGYTSNYICTMMSNEPSALWARTKMVIC